MKKIFTFIAVIFLSVSLYSCGIKGHNRAEFKPVNADDKRIYGEIGGPAEQTKKTYADDETGKTAERIANIKKKMYPK